MDHLMLAHTADERERTSLAAIAGSVVVGVMRDQPEASPVRAGSAKRVLVGPWLICGKCERCRAGLSGQCRSGSILGTRAAPGGLSGPVSVPRASVHPIPDALNDEVASFAPLVGDVAHMLQQVAIRDRNFVTILGNSPLAIVAGQVLTRHNKAVRILGDEPESLACCDNLGIKHRLMHEVTRRRDQDVVVLCDLRPEVVDLALALVRPRGELAIKIAPPTAASQADPPSPRLPPSVIDAIVRMELRVSGSWFGSARIGLALLERGEADVVPLIARRIDPATAVALLASTPDAADTDLLASGCSPLDRMVVRMPRS
ncbi:MAG: alcohol dehydrogenase catalytic domain-containing protein [Phycisphaerales bacterium]